MLHIMSLGNCKLKQWDTTIQLSEWWKSKNTDNYIIRIWKNRNSDSLLMGMQNGTAFPVILQQIPDHSVPANG